VDFSNKSEKATHDKIVSLVDQITAAKKKLTTATSDRDKNYLVAPYQLLKVLITCLFC